MVVLGVSITKSFEPLLWVTITDSYMSHPFSEVLQRRVISAFFLGKFLGLLEGPVEMIEEGQRKFRIDLLIGYFE